MWKVTGTRLYVQLLNVMSPKIPQEVRVKNFKTAVVGWWEAAKAAKAAAAAAAASWAPR